MVCVGDGVPGGCTLMNFEIASPQVPQVPQVQLNPRRSLALGTRLVHAADGIMLLPVFGRANPITVRQVKASQSISIEISRERVPK